MAINIVHNIMVERLIYHETKEACLYVAILFSDVLKKRHIDHRLRMGYVNMNIPSCSNGVKRSVLHFWIEADDVVYDPCTKAGMLNGLPVGLQDGKPEGQPTFVHYADKPLYDRVDQAGERQLTDEFRVYETKGSPAFWARYRAMIVLAHAPGLRRDKPPEYIAMLDKFIAVDKLVNDITGMM